MASRILAAATATVSLTGAALGSAGPASAQPAWTPGPVYAQDCALCHGPEMRGSEAAPSLRGPQFFFSWSGKSAADLLDFVRTKMPPGMAGSLSDKDYLETVSGIFAANGLLGAGARLPTDPAALANLKISKPQ